MSISAPAPANFRSIIFDFTTDLSTTFPEYSFMWQKWATKDQSEEEMANLFEYCKTVYPERFFDILYQNADIFNPDNETNTIFLPNVDFKLLMNCLDVSEKTKTTIWKYLQLVLFTIVGEIKDKSNFGETMNMFDGIEEKDLQQKLQEAFSGIGDLFKNMDKPDDAAAATADDTEPAAPSFEMPNMENVQDHLKTLFEGKIGSLAKEMAEEISGEFADILGGTPNTDINNTSDVLKLLMKNPKKIMDLMKKIGGKLDQKMNSGEISRDEIMKEAAEIFKKMKSEGREDQFQDMFKNIAQTMGGKLGKNMRFDTNAMNRMQETLLMKERSGRKQEENKLKKMEEQMRTQQQLAKQREENLQNQIKYSLAAKNNSNDLVFKIDGADAQERTFIHPDILKEIEEEDKKKAAATANAPKKNKKKKTGKK
jgi:hypothetical protein